MFSSSSSASHARLQYVAIGSKAVLTRDQLKLLIHIFENTSQAVFKRNTYLETNYNNHSYVVTFKATVLVTKNASGEVLVNLVSNKCLYQNQSKAVFVVNTQSLTSDIWQRVVKCMEFSVANEHALAVCQTSIEKETHQFARLSGLSPDLPLFVTEKSKDKLDVSAFIVMDQVNGIILSKSIAQNKNNLLSLKKTISILIALTKAYIDSFVKNNIVHGHLHPDNIFVDEIDDKYNIIFLGLKNANFPATYKTLEYVAPELLDKATLSDNHNHATDLFSFIMIILKIFGYDWDTEMNNLLEQKSINLQSFWQQYNDQNWSKELIPLVANLNKNCYQTDFRQVLALNELDSPQVNIFITTIKTVLERQAIEEPWAFVLDNLQQIYNISNHHVFFQNTFMIEIMQGLQDTRFFQKLKEAVFCDYTSLLVPIADTDQNNRLEDQLIADLLKNIFNYMRSIISPKNSKRAVSTSSSSSSNTASETQPLLESDHFRFLSKEVLIPQKFKEQRHLLRDLLIIIRDVEPSELVSTLRDYLGSNQQVIDQHLLIAVTSAIDNHVKSQSPSCCLIL